VGTGVPPEGMAMAGGGILPEWWSSAAAAALGPDWLSSVLTAASAPASTVAGNQRSEAWEKKGWPFEEPLLADEGDTVAARLGRRRQFLLPLQPSTSTLPKQFYLFIHLFYMN